MADENRPAADRVGQLLDELRRQPHKFDFHQALRRLEAALGRSPRLGTSLRPADDPIRLSQEPSMTFAPSTLASCEPGAGGRRPRLAVYFLGLFGPNGPLPLHMTEYARDRIRNSQDATFARFTDIFHHRALSLFYRAWSAAQPTTHYDRPDSDRFVAYVGALAGIGMPSLTDRDEMPDLAKLHFAGRLVCQTRHPEGLQALLNEFFQLPMQLDEFIGHWVRLPDDCRCVLGGGGSGSATNSPLSPRGRGAGGEGASSAQPLGAPLGTGQLGISATIGERVWDCQQKFRIIAGPMGFADYERLLPGGASLRRLLSVVDNYVGLALDWDLHLILKKQEVPATQLGSLGRLGWTTWLVSQPSPRDAADLVLQPRPEAA
jgi:type VI secretion system protein ImpH